MTLLLSFPSFQDVLVSRRILGEFSRVLEIVEVLGGRERLKKVFMKTDPIVSVRFESVTDIETRMFVVTPRGIFTALLSRSENVLPILSARL